MGFRRALERLEYKEALRWVGSFASTRRGRLRVEGLRPLTDLDEVRIRLDEVTEARRFLEERGPWAVADTAGAARAAARLGVEGAVLSANELATIAECLGAARGALNRLRNLEEMPRLRELSGALFSDQALKDLLDRSVERGAGVRSGASGQLARIRSRLRGAHAKVVRRLEKMLKAMDSRYRVPGASVTIRDGRYAIPLRREGMRSVGGYVHDESATGGTVFVEPPPAIELMNQARALERAEVRETQRILAKLSKRVRKRLGPIQDSIDALDELDSRLARARAAQSWRGSAPEMGAGAIRIREGRHPLLAAKDGGAVVPFDLRLGEDERLVVVTGPNTGGKTVFLKAVGLISALAQSGVHPPVGKHSRLPVFDSFFVAMGDEQSVEDSLSTFSAHLLVLRDILGSAGSRSLALIDEPGSGTDPAEGEALACAVVHALDERRCRGVVTSHLGGMKRLAARDNGIVNASLEFDASRAQPTYRFRQGRPGRSYGLLIARKLGIPEAVIRRARSLRREGDLRLEELLQGLEEKERTLELLEARRAEDARRVEKESKRVADAEARLREEKRAWAQRDRAEARAHLLAARRRVEDTINELLREARAGGSLEAAAKKARRSIEGMVRELGAGKEEARGARAPEARAKPLGQGAKAGDWVVVRESGALGVIREIRSGRAVIDLDGIKLRLPLDRLARVEGPPKRERAPADSPSDPSELPAGALVGEPQTDLYLRGRRVHEAEVIVQRAIDDARVSGSPELRIVHGSGTGALRKRVAEILRADDRVLKFGPAPQREGGFGVTVATLR